MDIIPIWKDTYYTTTATTEVEFYILKDNEYEIFHGSAKPAPETQLINFRLNPLCGSYLNSKLPTEALAQTGDTVASQEGYGEFTLYIFNPVTQLFDAAYSWAFVNDWSYMEHEPAGAYSEPINGHFAPGQILPYSYLHTGATATNICYEINS